MNEYRFEKVDINLSRDEIYESEDLSQLTEWLDDLQEAAGDMREYIDAMSLVPGYCLVASARRLAFLQMMKKCVNRRISDIDPKYQKPQKSNHGLKSHLEEMMKVLYRYKEENKNLRQTVHELKHARNRN